MIEPEEKILQVAYARSNVLTNFVSLYGGHISRRKVLPVKTDCFSHRFNVTAQIFDFGHIGCS
jgi:hypothetical protein